jgi:hypothetical protein
MGYEVHITRKASWFEDDGPVISLNEWLEYLSSDAEMRLDGYAEARTPAGDVLRTEEPGIAVWTAYSRHGVDGNMAWFCHFGDRITVKNPDEEIRAKMYAIASSLGAKVQGDEGELYGPDGASVEEKAQMKTKFAEASLTEPRRKPWWKFWE